MATNPYFNLHGTSTPEQRLIENLNIEAIKTYGIDVYYCPRTLINEDELLGESQGSSFNSAHMIEMYIKSVDGFEGDGDFVAKWGVQIKDQVTFSVARRRWSELNVQGEGRADQPHEGDVIYFPLTKNLWEIQFVEDEAPFYQTGSLQFFDLLCELFTYSDQNFNTGVEDIDKIERSASYSIDFTMDSGSGNFTVGEQVYQGTSFGSATVKGEVASWNSTSKILNLINMTGNFSGTSNIIGNDSSASWSVDSFDAQTSAADTGQSSNAAIEAEADAIIDFTEGNPFGSL